MNLLPTLKKILASSAAAALLIAIPGPACYQALAAGIVVNTAGTRAGTQPSIALPAANSNPSVTSAGIGTLAAPTGQTSLPAASVPAQAPAAAVSAAQSALPAPQAESAAASDNAALASAVAAAHAVGAPAQAFSDQSNPSAAQFAATHNMSLMGKLSQLSQEPQRLPQAFDNSRSLSPSASLTSALTLLGAGLMTVIGGAHSRNKDSDLDREAKSMLGGKNRKQEVFFPDMYRGRINLKYLSQVKTHLDEAEQARIDAFKTLIRIGLAPKGQDDSRQALLKQLDNPTPAMEAMLAELGLDAATVRSWQPIVDANKIDQDNDIPAEVMDRASRLGLFRLKIPKEYGGLGLHQREYGQVLRVFADISSSIGTNVSADNTIGSAPMLMFGTPAQKKKYLEAKAQGRFLASFGLTEPGAGTDTKKLAATVQLPDDLNVDLSEFDHVDPNDRKAQKAAQEGKLARITEALRNSGQSVRLTGEKVFITGVVDAGLVYVVAGHTMWKGQDLGPSVFIAEPPFLLNESWADKKKKIWDLGQRGMRITSFTRDGFRLPVIRGSDQALIQFNNFEIPAANLLGEVGEGVKVPLQSLNKGRIGFGPILAGGAAWFATVMREWAADRAMFDMYKPKDRPGPGYQGDMEYAQAKIGAAHRKSAALDAVSEMTSALADANDSDKMGVAALSAAIKSRVATQNWEIAQDARELGGGHALFEGEPRGIERESRYAWIFKIVEGVDAAMAQAVHLFGGYVIQYELMKPLGAAKYILNQVAARVPFITSDTGVLSMSEAKWLKKRVASFALRFGIMGFARDMLPKWMPFLRTRFGLQQLAYRQNTMIRAYNVEMDLFTLAAVQIKLHKDAGRLTPMETLALKSAVEVLKYNIDHEMPFISLFGHPVENIDRDLGKAVMDQEYAKRGQRPDRYQEHMNWVHGQADAWWAKLEAEFASAGQ